MITAQPMIGKAHTAGFLHLGQSRGRAAAVNLLTSRGCREGLTAASTGTQSTAEEPRPQPQDQQPCLHRRLECAQRFGGDCRVI